MHASGNQTQTRLSIILVNWNNRDFLRQCLDSIAECSLAIPYEIVVSDNGSTDGSLAMLAESFPDVRVVLNGANVGVARANNEGIKVSNGEYVYILNNDTLVNKASVEAMVRHLDGHPGVAAVGGNLLNPDGTLQATFCRFPTLWEEFLLVTHLGVVRNPLFPSHKRPCQAPRAVDWLSSASIVVRRSALEGIGLVDEDYFIYSDETDWQYRLWQAGWQVFYLPDVSTIHFGGGSFTPGGRRYTLVYRGRMLFARKHYSRLYCMAQRMLFGAAALGRQAVWLVLAPFPKWRSVAKRQLASNWETLELCFRLR